MPLYALGDLQNFKSSKVLSRMLKIWYNVAFKHRSVLRIHFLTGMFLYFFDRVAHGTLVGPYNLKSAKILYRLHSKFDATFLWNTGVRKWYCLKKKFLGPPIILNLRQFFTDCFQNLAQRFIRIQKYFNNIVFKKMWLSGLLRTPKISRSVSIAFIILDKVIFESSSAFISLF